MNQLFKVLLVSAIALSGVLLLGVGSSQAQPPNDPFGGNDPFAQQGDPEAAAAAAMGSMLCTCVFGLIVAIAIPALSYWKMFEKAGKPGWASIVPIYNIITLIEISGRPVWWFILLFIPCVGIVISILVNIDVARKFGQEAIFGIGLALLPFVFGPILGFGSARYNPAA